jgi:crossover junction endodeoxyribonuclease RusA
MKCELILGWPPSVNTYKRPGKLSITKTGKIYQPRVNTIETQRYFYDVWLKVRHQKLTEGLKSFDSGTISVEVDAHPPDAKKRDIDNICKVLLDSLVHGKLIADDSMVARLLVTRMNIIPGGRVVVRIKQIECL